MSETMPSEHLLTEDQVDDIFYRYESMGFPERDAMKQLDAHIDALQDQSTQQSWDMRSLGLTIENLRGEVERYTQGLDDVWESCRSWRAKGLPTDGLESVQGQIGALIAALEGGE